MKSQNAKIVADQLGNIELPSDRLKAEIKRLNRTNVVTLKQVEVLHLWLEGKRQAKQSFEWLGNLEQVKQLLVILID